MKKDSGKVFCELGCDRPAKFEIRRIKTDRWIKVCGTHDSFVGVENLIAQGCSKEEAEEINKQVKKGA